MHRIPEQNRKIWGLVAKLGQISGRGREWAEGIMRLICGGLTGSESTSQLTPEQADRLIAELQARVGSKAPRPKHAPDAAATITPDQQRTLDHMYKDAGVSVPQAFNQRIVKKAWAQTRGEANKIYQALEAMIIRKIDRTEVETILATLRSVEFKWRLTPWEKSFVEDLNRQITAATGSGTWRTSRKLGKLLEIWRVRAEAKEMGAKPSKSRGSLTNG
jgi:hypothetical protein